MAKNLGNFMASYHNDSLPVFKPFQNTHLKKKNQEDNKHIISRNLFLFSLQQVMFRLSSSSCSTIPPRIVSTPGAGFKIAALRPVHLPRILG